MKRSQFFLLAAALLMISLYGMYTLLVAMNEGSTQRRYLSKELISNFRNEIYHLREIYPDYREFDKVSAKFIEDFEKYVNSTLDYRAVIYNESNLDSSGNLFSTNLGLCGESFEVTDLLYVKCFCIKIISPYDNATDVFCV